MKRFLTNRTHDGSENPPFEKGLGERERHAHGGHEKVSNGQIDQEYGQVRFGAVIEQEDQNDDKIGDYCRQR